ncbi:MAG: T9SS type A sorting domain-containing protein [Bacteroidia bacterium]
MKFKNTSLLFTIALIFRFLMVNASGPWTSLNGPFGYNSPQTIIYHQGAIYVSTNLNGSTGTGVYKSTNGGTSWVDVSAGLPLPYARDIEAIGNNIFVACDTGVYTSINQGASWMAADNTLPVYTNVYEMVVHQGELYAAVYYGSGITDLFKTGNNGQSWTYTGYSVGSSISLNHLYSSGNTLWASTTAGVYKSADGGATFNSASNNIPFSASINSIVAQGDTAYCGTSNGTYYTTDGGQQWNLITISGLGNPIFTYSWEIIGSTVYAGLNNNGIYSSPLGQNNWSVFGTGYYNYNFPWMLTNDGASIYAATIEGIFSCSIPSGTWTSKNGNITRARTSIGWADNNLVLAGSGFNSGIKRTQNGGANWTNTNINNQQGLYKSGIKINNTIFIPSNYTMYSSTDDGLTWTSPLIAPIPNYDIAKFGNYLIAPAGSKVAYSDDLGQTWNPYSSGIPINGTVNSVCVMGQSAFAGYNNSIYKMEYPGAPWTIFNQGILPNGFINSILSIENTLIMSNSSGVYRRTMEDSLWRLLSPNSYARDLVYAKGYIFSATYNGINFSDDLGKSFHPWNDGLPNYLGAVENLFADGDILYAGTEQFSAWKRTIEPELSITVSPTNTSCTGSTVSVSAVSTVPLNANNKYYLQLSDNNGRFLNPRILDSLSGNAQMVSFNTILSDSIVTGTQYRVRVVSSSPYLLATASDIEFTILQRAHIKLQPANQNVCEGQGTGFYVGAEGDLLNYQWQVDQSGSGNYTNLLNNSIYQDVNSSLLLILNPTPGMNGYRYRCEISNTCGNINSNYGTLNVNAIIGTISNQPVATTVCTGLPASFTVTATGAGSSYQWQVNSGFGVFSNISNSSQYSGVTTSSLSINFTSTNMNGYTYRCKIGNCLYSDSATLVVNGAPITSSILMQELFCDGGNAQFSVFVAGANVTYQWEEDNGSGFTSIMNGANYIGATDPVLQLLNIPASYNNYLYRCNISSLCSPGTSTTNNGELILSPSPTVLSQPINNTVCEGDSASFTAVGSGSLLNYNWEINTGSGWASIPPLSPYSGVNSNTLQLAYTNSSMQSHQFRCRLSGCVTTNNATLNLLAVPQVMASDITVCVNQLPYSLNSGLPTGGIYFGNEIYNGSFQPNSSNTGGYNYYYHFLSPNGCSASANGNIQLSTCTDVDELNVDKNGIMVFPNPTRSTATLSFRELADEETALQFFTLEGRLIETRVLPARQQNVELNVSGWSDGLYLIRVTNHSYSKTLKLLVFH